MEGKEAPWQLTLTADEGLPMSEWIKLVVDAAKMGLEQVTSEDDILNMFKVNRTIFDKVKAEDEEQHIELMKLFKTRKDELKGE